MGIGTDIAESLERQHRQRRRRFWGKVWALALLAYTLCALYGTLQWWDFKRFLGLLAEVAMIRIALKELDS